MKRLDRRAKLAVAALITAAGLSASPAYAAGWAYEGGSGPGAWGALSPDNAACLGQQQSPIDLVTTNTAEIDPLAINWSSMPLEIVDNGHTVQANVQAGNTTRFGNRRFELLQVHFHASSEHTFLGRHFPVEAHFVHQSPEGDLLVLGVMIEQGDANPALDAIWRSGSEGGLAPTLGAPALAPTLGTTTDHGSSGSSGGGHAGIKMPVMLNDQMATGMMPTDMMMTASIAPNAGTATQAVDLSGMLPARQGRFQYAGSLTTPPCSEIVNWVIFSSPISASAEQIELFTSRYDSNYRPVQDRNRRFVLYGN